MNKAWQDYFATELRFNIPDDRAAPYQVERLCRKAFEAGYSAGKEESSDD